MLWLVVCTAACNASGVHDPPPPPHPPFLLQEHDPSIADADAPRHYFDDMAHCNEASTSQVLGVDVLQGERLRVLGRVVLMGAVPWMRDATRRDATQAHVRSNECGCMGIIDSPRQLFTCQLVGLPLGPHGMLACPRPRAERSRQCICLGFDGHGHTYTASLGRAHRPPLQ